MSGVVRPGAAELERRLEYSLREVLQYWPATLTPSRAGGSVASTAPGSRPPISDGLIKQRAEVLLLLSDVARQVFDRRRLSRRLPDDDVPDLVEFLRRHVEWIAEQPDAVQLVSAVARARAIARSMAEPDREREQSLGRCPLIVEEWVTLRRSQAPKEPVEDVEQLRDGVELRQIGEIVDKALAPRECGGTVRTMPDQVTDAECDKCGTVATVDWWETVIVGVDEAKTLLTSDELVTFLHRNYGKVVKRETIRTWQHRGWLTAQGRDDKGRTLYSRGDVPYLQRRGALA